LFPQRRCPDRNDSVSMASVEEFRDKHISLKVEQASDGFWMGVTLLARIPLPPEEVYSILVSPENHKVFRSIKAFRNRQIIAVNKNGVEVVEVEQLGQWRFGPFRGQFSVKLHVEQDHHRRSIKFRLAPSKRASFMRKFNGEWEVKPFNGDSVEEMLSHTNNKHKNPLHGIGTALHRLEVGFFPSAALFLRVTILLRFILQITN
jgi:hypothetical protein